MTDQCLTAEQLRDYISETGNSEEQKHLEQHLSDCELCSSALESIEKAVEAELFDDDRFQKFENAFTNKIEQIADKNKSGNSYYALLKYAAIFLLLLNVGTFAYFISGDQTSRQQFQAYHFSQRGAIQTEDEMLDKAVQLYEARDYPESLQLLEQISQDNDRLELIVFLKANAYAATDQNQKAILHFEQILQNESWNLYKKEVRKSLGYLYSRQK